MELQEKGILNFEFKCDRILISPKFRQNLIYNLLKYFGKFWLENWLRCCISHNNSIFFFKVKGLIKQKVVKYVLNFDMTPIFFFFDMSIGSYFNHNSKTAFE